MKHILVVEDDPHNALVFRKILEKRGGFRVTVSESAEEILALARSGEIQIVIMDVSLPNTRYENKAVGGVELCRMIKSDARSVGVVVLLATAHAMRGDAETLLAESGADDYVAKPIVDHDAFVEQVKALLAEAA
jgi:CheY-like chemotaxis protein